MHVCGRKLKDLEEIHADVYFNSIQILSIPINWFQVSIDKKYQHITSLNSHISLNKHTDPTSFLHNILHVYTQEGQTSQGISWHVFTCPDLSLKEVLKALIHSLPKVSSYTVHHWVLTLSVPVSLFQSFQFLMHILLNSKWQMTISSSPVLISLQ